MTKRASKPDTPADLKLLRVSRRRIKLRHCSRGWVRENDIFSQSSRSSGEKARWRASEEAPAGGLHYLH